VSWATRYPYWFRVTMKRDQMIEFYTWMVEERAWDGRVFVNSNREHQLKIAIKTWESRAETETGNLEIHFRNEADAVFFRLRFVDADYRGQDSAIRKEQA
jgi:hypothetical protein